MQALPFNKRASDTEWRLGVGVGQYGAAVAAEKGEIEAGLSTDARKWPLIATTRSRFAECDAPGYARIGCSQRSSRRIHVITSSSPTPLLRFVKTNGRPPRISLASRAMTSRLAPT